MAFSTVPTVNTSDSWTASQHNTYIKDNFAAVWVGTTAGDLDYYTSATGKSRLGIGSANQFLYSTGSAPAWGTLATLTGSVALFGSQAAGDIPYASSATAITRLAKGAAFTFLRSNGTTPEYGSMTYRRIGGSSTAWSTSGSNAYTPPIEIQQIGSVDLTLGSTAAVGFAVAYSANPHVMLTLSSISASDNIYTPYIYALSTTGFTVACSSQSGSTATVQINWVARGQ
jgi:hypothetical protein